LADLITRTMKGLVRELDQISAEFPGEAQAMLTLPSGQLQVLAYRPGYSDPARAWSGMVRWAGLILYPNNGGAEAYLIPNQAFPKTDGSHGILQRIDWTSETDPGVLWIDLANDAVFATRRTWLKEYRVR